VSAPAGDASPGRLGALRWALDQRTGDAIANLTLVMMARVANQSWRCYLSVAKLADIIECDPRTVQRKLRYLEVRRYIAPVEDRRRRTVTYRLHPEPDADGE
jgi:hypothetical protein